VRGLAVAVLELQGGAEGVADGEAEEGPSARSWVGEDMLVTRV
jgi:phosphoketolase